MGEGSFGYRFSAERGRASFSDNVPGQNVTAPFPIFYWEKIVNKRRKSKETNEAGFLGVI